jgi:LysR family hydrogen peroxide-inducible transcriptional activator
MLTLRQLRYFSALAATRHFGRAAGLAGISQPALSMQLKEMEAKLRGPLVERTPTGATLTELGRQVAERSGRILSAMRDLEELPRAHGAVLDGPLRLGIIPSVAPYLLPGLLDRTEKRYPALSLVVRETVTATLVSELADGSLDAIVASLPLGTGELAEAAAFEDRFLLAAPAGSPHAATTPAMAELIDADELLLLEDGHCLRDQALAICRTIDPRRLRSFGATSLATLLQLVAAGKGITLAPELALAAGAVSDKRLRLVRFAEPQPFRMIGVAWRRSSPRERDYRALADLMTSCRPTVGGHDTPLEHG